MKLTASSLPRFTRDTFRDWRRLSPGILAGGLSYFASLSLPPLVVIIGAVVGHVVGGRSIYFELDQTVGTKAAQSALHWINLAKQAQSPTRTTLSTILLLFVASRVFAHLQTVYHILWELPATENVFQHGFFKHTVIPAILIVATGLFTFTFMLLAPVVGSLSLFLGHFLPQNIGLRKFLYFMFSMSLFTVMFGALNIGLPHVELKWSDVWPGAFVTALLFAIARRMLMVYFNFKSFDTIYGAAGSVVLIMIWVYFSAHIFVFGAVLTRRYALSFGTQSRKK